MRSISKNYTIFRKENLHGRSKLYGGAERRLHRRFNRGQGAAQRTEERGIGFFVGAVLALQVCVFIFVAYHFFVSPPIQANKKALKFVRTRTRFKAGFILYLVSSTNKYSVDIYLT